MHWNETNATSGRVNAAVVAVTDPVSGQPALKGALVSLCRHEVDWYGFAASAAQMQPGAPYSAIARTTTGSSCELAGMTPVADWEQEARNALNLATGTASIMRDTTKGTVRVAIHDNEILKGLFFVSPQPVLVSRELAVSLINTPEPALTALAGIPRSGQADPGRVVCACLNVGINTLRQAIHDGARSVPELGKCTSAGTSCGSCKPELQSLIDATPALIAAE